MDWALVEEIPDCAGALREAESRWITQRNIKKETGQDWKNKSPEAFKLWAEIISIFKFAYRNNESIVNRINAIIGNSAAQVTKIQGLNDFSVLGKNNPEELELIHFDFELLDKAANLSDETADLLAAKKADDEYNTAKKIRDQAYTYLKRIIQEIYSFGQFVFRHDKKRKQGYASSYYRRTKNNPPINQDQTENERIAA